MLPTQSRPNYTLVKVFGVIGGFAVITAFVSMAVDHSNYKAQTPGAPPAVTSTSRIGSISTMARDAIVGNTKDDLSEVVTLAVADDKQGLMGMVVRGRAFIVTTGTSVRLIDGSWASKRIRVLDGPHRGRDGWTSMESVR